MNLLYDIQSILVEVNLFNRNWLLCGCYHVPSQHDKYLFDQSGNVHNKYNQNHEKFLLIGNFKAEKQNQVCLNFYMNAKLRI